jgi:hypothetical protein
VNTFYLSTRILPSPSLFALHPYLTPTRHIPYFPPNSYSAPLCLFGTTPPLFSFTRTPHIPGDRPILAVYQRRTQFFLTAYPALFPPVPLEFAFVAFDKNPPLPPLP